MYIIRNTIFISLILVFSPSSSFAIEKEELREALGEECFEVIHDIESFTEEEVAQCRKRVREISNLVITPTRTGKDIQEVPASVSLITSKEIANKSADSVAELLRDVPGVEVSDAGQSGLKRIRIRGEEARRVTILIDGQRFIDHREVGTPLLISPEVIERIEVVRGTGSVLHGSRAVGGVINIITKKGGFHPLQATVSAQYYSATEGEQYFGSLYGSSNGFDYRLSGSKSEHEDRNTPEGEVEDTSYSNQSISAYLGKNWENHSLAFSYDNYNSDSEVHVDPIVATTPPFTSFKIDSPQRDRDKVALFYDGKNFGDFLKKVHVDGYFQTSDRKFNTFSDLSLFVGFPLIRNSDVFTTSTLDTLGGNAQLDWSMGSHYLIAGIEATTEELSQTRRREVVNNDVVSPTELTNDEAQQDSVDLFIQDEWSISDSIAFILGGRGIWVESELEETNRVGLVPNSTDDSHVIFSTSLSYTGIRNTTTWVSFSQGYVYPSLVNLATGAFAGPDFVNPNENLDPETSNTGEVGLRFDDGRLNFDIATFITKAKNYIDHVKCSSTVTFCVMPAVGRGDRVYLNIDESQTFGVELNGAYRINSIRPYGSLAWLRRRFQSISETTYNTGLPNFSGRFGVQYEQYLSPEVLFWADAYIRSASESDESDGEEEIEHKGGWSSYNVALGANIGQKGQYKIIIEGQNLGDKSYTESSENISASGRNISIKFVASI